VSTETTEHAETAAEAVSAILMDMDLPSAMHAMIPEYVTVHTYRVERECLSFQGVWEGAQVQCVVSTRHGRPTVSITITG
jgi:hypothetical protein